MSGFAILALLLAAMSGIQDTQDRTAEARKAFDDGNARYEKNDNAKALDAFDRAISLDPKKADYHLARCRTLARLQRHTDAIASCTDALTLDPELGEAWLGRGHYEINARMAAKARPDLEKARALNANPHEVSYHLALAHYMLGAYDEASSEYETCIATSKTPDDTVACRAWQYLALVRAGKKNEAATALHQITPDMKVQSAAAYLNRLLLFQGVKTEHEVAAGMTDNLQMPTVAYGLGMWHLLNNREAQARQYFEKATTPPAQLSAFGSVAAFYELQRMTK